MSMKCPKCKREIDNDSVFCESCGTRIKKSKKGLWIALAVVAILAVTGGGVSVYNTQQEELRIERERLEKEAREAAEYQAELEAQLEAERIAKEEAEKARKEAERIAKEEAEKARKEAEQKAKASSKGTHNGHEWVDLGLSVKWATCNVGASTPEGYGKYYAWGETTTKSSYKESNYTYSSNPTTLPLNRDAVAVNWGGNWRMPTLDEIKELKEKCKWTWTGRGCTVTGPNGNSIFLPAAGYRYYSDLYYAGSYGYYWSSSLDTNGSDSAYSLDFGSDNVDWSSYYYRYYGRSVRGVLP